MEQQWTDEELVDHVRQGSMDAYSVLVNRHKNRVFTLILCRIKDREAAEELAQDVFIKLYRHLSGFRGEAAFATWLYQVTLNTVRDYCKARRRKPVAAVLDTIKGWFAEEGNGPEEQVIAQEERQTVVSLLGKLPDKYRNVLYLYHYCQMSYNEIAGFEGIPVKTVETRLYRGKKLLKEQWLEVNRLDYEASGGSNAGKVSKPQSDA